MEHRRRQESPDADWKAVEGGWFLGDKAFKEELLAQMHERRKDHYDACPVEAPAKKAWVISVRQL